MNFFFTAAIPTLLFASTLITNAQPLRVQILNGKNGKPVANEHVNVFRTGDFGDLAGNRDHREFNTDANGIFTVSQIAPETNSFTVAVDWHRPCAKTYAKFSLHEIFSKGLVSQNSCKPKLERSATPGTLILFVREETFFEKMAH
jgi:hypothetical protein